MFDSRTEEQPRLSVDAVFHNLVDCGAGNFVLIDCDLQLALVVVAADLANAIEVVSGGHTFRDGAAKVSAVYKITNLDFKRNVVKHCAVTLCKKPLSKSKRRSSQAGNSHVWIDVSEAG